MKLFLDTSVILAALGSAQGAAREIFEQAEQQAWRLVVTPYVLAEVSANFSCLPSSANSLWPTYHNILEIRNDIITIDRPAVFGPTKDRPILFGALAWAEILLTLDQQDFGKLMNQEFYGLRILRPGTFLLEERISGRLKNTS